MSRLLRSLEAARLVTVGPSDTDKRIKTARLTAAGSAERAVLDERAERRAESLLDPLTPAQRVRTRWCDGGGRMPDDSSDG